jgi:YbbR domain-containing protein
MLKSLGKFFRNYVFNNVALKIIALAIAVLLWWSVGRDPMVEIPMTVPLEFLHAPSDLEINSNYPLQAQVTVRGPERLLQGMHPSEVHAILDLEGAGLGERTFDLTPRQVQVPRNARVVQIVPSQFHISFDRSATRTVDIKPRVIGALLSGYGITRVAADPPQVSVVGPEKRVKAIDSAITDPVDATGVVGSATFTTHAYVADPLVRVQTPAPIRVTINTEKISRRGGQP